MIDNGLIYAVMSNREEGVIESFTYNHERALEGYKPVTYYCTINVDIPNTYMKSLMDLLESNFFRFTDGKTHRDDDRFILDETTGVILTYTAYENSNKYTRKILIKNGDYVEILRREEDFSIIKVTTKENNNGSNNRRQIN